MMLGGGGSREYYGEMFDYGDRIEIRQEVGIGVTPEVKYSGNKIYITFGDEKREYEVGCLDEDSIKAHVKNGVLNIEARRCEDAGEDNESVSEEGEGGED